MMSNASGLFGATAGTSTGATAASGNARAQAMRSQYNREAILSASPARLLTMLYDRLLLDLSQAEAAQLGRDWQGASAKLLHAQDIITELTVSLDTKAWDGADALLGIYSYVSTALINANIHRDPALVREAITLLEPLRLSWHKAAVMQPAQAAVPGSGAGRLGFGVA